MITKEIVKKSFWALQANEVLDLLETTSDGLPDKETRERLKIFGKNKISARRKAAKLKIFLRQFTNPLIFILLIAGGITLLLKDFTDAIVILVAALANSLLGFYQENKAEEALTHLQSYIEERTRVIREGREFEIDAEELTPGDIIHVSQGDRVPTDARLIYINDLLVDESILTGESLPVTKAIEPVNFQAAIGDQTSMLFSGTAIAQGFADAVVCRTGPDTEIGRIASLVKSQKQEQTPLQKKIIKFSLKASIALLVLTGIIFMAGVFTGYSMLEMFLTSVAVLVSAVPEGLPVAMTVILAIGVQRLAKKNGVIRKLLAAETLGNTTVILTDKTGTLTEAKMELAKISIFNFAQEPYINEEFALKLALMNSDTVIENPDDPHNNWRIIGRPLEVAIVKAAAKSEILPSSVKKEMKIIDYLPFNSANKFSAVLLEYQSKTFLSLFGAPEVLLSLSTQTAEDKKQQIIQSINEMAYSGKKVLGIVIKEIDGPEKTRKLTVKQKFDQLKFLATISFTDPIRAGVRDAVHRIEQAGIKTIIVTGDHRGTAETVAKELGFPTHDENIINGSELDSLSNEELKKRLAKLRIVSRVSPEGKLKIAKAYREIGEIVAMTGDGINDAPSLKEADIGIAMGSGTDVAKDIAELVLLDDNYHTIVAAIEEGRRIAENIRKVIVYLLSSVLDELILIGGALFMGLALPLSAVQILWVNFFTDSFPAVALAFEDGIDHLSQKPAKLSKNLLDKEMRFLIFAIGVPTSFLLFGTYWLFLRLGFDAQLTRTFIFASFGTYSLFLIFAVRSLRKSIFTYNPFSNPSLVFGVGIGLLLMAVAIYLPSMQKLLGTVALPPLWLAGVAAIGITNVIAIELGKWIYRK